LLEPLTLRNVTARNRILFGPHETNLGQGRALSDRHLAYYERRARGGVGILVAEEASVHDSDWPYERCPLATACAEGWRELADCCHAHGALAFAALGHSGGQGSSAYSQSVLWAPSAVPEVNTREVPKVMEPEDITAVLRGFEQAAGLAAASGLDGVEINAGQHSLIRQFLSALTNLRGDEYGQDKLRFAREALAAVRRGLGPNHVLGLRLSCDELAPWAGITPEAAAGLATELASLVDYLVVVRGAIFSVAATRPDMHDPPGFNLELCGQIRTALQGAVPVFAQGSIVDWEQAEQALADDRADGVEMTRAQIADPDLVAKVVAGHTERIRPCLLCNQRCKVRDNRNPLVSCVVEPRSGYEWHDPDVDRLATAAADQAPHGKAEVLVIGAGPAGLECARVLASAGQPVQVVDAGRVGGLPGLASAVRGRDRLALASAWLETECRRLGVKLIEGSATTPEAAVAHQGPVVVATGGRDRPPEYEVVDGARVVSAAELVAGGFVVAGFAAAELVAAPFVSADTPQPDGSVVVWDPVGGPIAVGIAEELAARGHNTLLATPDVVVGTQLSLSGDLAPANVRLHQAGVELVRRVVLRRVEPGRVVLEDRFAGTLVEREVGWLVDCGHRLPDDTAWPADAVRIGDAVAPRTIHEAILDGRRAALTLLETQGSHAKRRPLVEVDR
jgi:2,4-dienoyl-CoA reductase (NADPH2)